MAGRHSAAPRGDDDAARSRQDAMAIHARHAATMPATPGSRSSPGDGGARRRRWRRIALALASTLAIAGTVVVAVTWPHLTSHAGAHGTGSCRGQQSLQVIAAPAIAPAITAIANDWRSTHPAVNGICVQVSVTAQDSYNAEQDLVSVSTATVWIPDSTVWSSRLLTDAPGLASQLTVGAPVAKSPLVAVVAPARAASLAAAAQHGWAAMLDGKTRVGLPDPTTTTEGALTLLGLQAQLGTSSAGRAEMGSLFLQLTDHVMPNTAAGFASLQDFPTMAPAFVATEQQVIAANKGKSQPVTAAVYPSGTSVALDFPFVAITPSRGNVLTAALRAFEHQLAQPSSAHALNAVNLRDAAGAPIPGGSDANRALAPQVKLAPAATRSSLGSVLRRWVAAREPKQLLAVIDVSGSMRDDSGNGHSKIGVASDAAAQAVTLMPDSWSVGLWTFSRRPTPALDYTELVPIGAVQANRNSVLAATRSMPSLAGGDTALYSTALAAYQVATSHYAPKRANAVLLMTDGANVDPDDADLPALIAQLKALADPHRPVSIITIALGKDADVGALRQISAATGGRTYVVRQAQDIRTVFVQIALQGA